MTNNKKPPNILVLVLDALRARNVSCYGYAKPTTPNLDSFADEATLFSRAFTTSTWTIPTHASMLSGLYLSEHRIENIERNRRFNNKIIPLPVALGSSGYVTAGFSHNPLFSPTYQFDFFDDFFIPGGLSELPKLPDELARDIGKIKKFQAMIGRYRDKLIRPRMMFDALQSWIENHDGDRPFFLMANLINIHYPWAPPPDLLLRGFGLKMGRLKKEYLIPEPWPFNAGIRQVTADHRHNWRMLYDLAIKHVDREFGRFAERLRRWPGWEDLVIVILADHGELLGDHQDIIGHTLSLHDNLLHVPLIIKHPEYPRGVSVEGVVQTIDLYSSALEWGKIPLDSVPPAQISRDSYSKAIRNPTAVEGFAFAEEDYTDSYDVIGGLLGVNPAMDPQKYPRRQIAVRSADYKYIWYADRSPELFILHDDPEEQINVIADPQYQDQRSVMARALDNWRAGLASFPPQEIKPVDADDLLQSRLKSLGYLA